MLVLPITNCAADIVVGGTGSSNAATRVLVMGEDSNPRSVARGSNIFKRVLGELKNNSDYNSKTIYLHKDLFKSNFGKVFSTFLHELSHATGNGDGSREFSDCLTFLHEQSIEKNKKIQTKYYFLVIKMKIKNGMEK